jgi:hypothetical protein
MLKTTDIDGKGLMVVQKAVCDSRRKVLPTVPKNVSGGHNAVEGVQHVNYSLWTEICAATTGKTS